MAENWGYRGLDGRQLLMMLINVSFTELEPAQATESYALSEEEEEEYEEPASAYTSLLQTLQATNESFAKAYAPRYSAHLLFNQWDWYY